MERTERVGGRQRKKSRPVSELITIFDHQQFEDRKIEQWQSEKLLNLKREFKIADKEKTEKATAASAHTGNLDSSKTKLSEKSEKRVSPIVQPKPVHEQVQEIKGASGKALGKSMITLTLKPKAGTDRKQTSLSLDEPAKKQRESPKIKVVKAKKKTVEPNVPKALEQNIENRQDDAEPKAEGEVTDDTGDRKIYPIDNSLAELRREMHSLRKQDVELMSQLLTLNSSIQNFKFSKNSMSDLSDISDETEANDLDTAMQPSLQDNGAGWGTRRSLGSDGSDFEVRDSEAEMRPKERKLAVAQNRQSIDSEVSGYYSYNTSPYGSDSSLNGYTVGPYDNTGSENTLPANQQMLTGSNSAAQMFIEDEYALPVTHQVYPGSECGLPVESQMYSRSESELPVNHRIQDPRSMAPRAGHSRRFTCPPEEGQISHQRTGSDPFSDAMYRKSSLPVHSAQSDYAEDVRVKRKLLINQSRRHSCMVTSTSGFQSPRSISRSGSEHSLYGYDVSCDDSDRMTPPLPVTRMQKWQRCNSTSALNMGRGTQPTIQRTVRLDLRQNVPAIELVLPIQPVTRRSEARMAERRPLNKLNSTTKRQSMIW